MSKSSKKIAISILVIVLTALFTFEFKTEVQASSVTEGKYELLDADAYSEIIYSDISGKKTYAGNITDFNLALGQAQNSVTLAYSIGEDSFVFEGTLYSALANGNSRWYVLDTMNGKKSAITMTLLIAKETKNPYIPSLVNEQETYKLILSSGAADISNFFEAGIRPKLQTRIAYKEN
ncbi:hypothetical protein [Enterococcus wangshanyuanii]|uniref:Uncharacterized protein n=1 Tax=Enterococcus wangshanyuanii TaxID=2005703 RepID=A0ABQ1P5R5_9ENTE|nr:hypothetical protein [Enterococcus wangshanyuanii]GGC91615.1 hypothetical protein GCM10011573_21500 [Enterococcus wangshanyuanii]